MKAKPLTPDDPRHGTANGYQAHRREGTNACDPRRKGMSAYTEAKRTERQDLGLPAGRWVPGPHGVLRFEEAS